MYTFVFVLLLSVQSYPVFAFISDHASMEDCAAAIVQFKAEPEVKELAGCLVIVKPENVGRGV